ncbi:hypothetical protein QP157_02135 [Sphingomonas sp. LR61]|uniref:hypothetical protein n=1 Tax=Sphingomonas sp. LR61 TaxID=3050234 RepID=UPI002FE34E9F
MSQLDKQDPRSQFPRPPFPAQTQQGSGLASAMDPPPDHGEVSYLGTGRMRGTACSSRVPTPASAEPRRSRWRRKGQTSH